jgi:hypothetical protein
MAKRSDRLLKKIHKRWLESDVLDLSQNSHWRKILFDSNPGEVFTIFHGCTQGLSRDAQEAVRRYGLHFSLKKIESSRAETWLSEGGFVVFEFWATAYPGVRVRSGNNPLVV